MKTAINLKNFFNLTQSLRWETLPKSLLSSLSSQRGLSRAQTTSETKQNETLNLKSLKSVKRWSLTTLRVLVDRVAAVRNSKSIVKAFPRFITGLVLLVWVAPYMDMFYTQLDPNDRVPATEWYYESYNWFFLCLGPYLKNFFTVIGIYMCLVHKSGLIRTAVVSYSLMYDIGKIIWLANVNNHDEYNSLPPDLFLIYGFITSVFIVLMIDQLSFWVNHRFEAWKRRLQGIRNIADKASPEQVVVAFTQTMDYGDSVQEFKEHKDLIIKRLLKAQN